MKRCDTIEKLVKPSKRNFRDHIGTKENQENFKRGCTEILVLYLLTKEDLYGYQITQLFKEKSNGRFTMLEGTLYLILYKLVELGYLSTYSKTVGIKRMRKYYHLEPSGQEYLNRILNEYDEITKGIAMILDREVQNYEQD